MRANARWFRAETPKTPEQVGAALAIAAWSASRAFLDGLRRARFEIAPGPAYFRILSEALAFAIQVAWRAVHAHYSEPRRAAFAHALAHGAARILADNEAELLGRESASRIARRFIDELNARFEEYGEFGFDADGPDFAFLRYLATRVESALPEADRPWIHDAVIAVAGPRAADRIATTLVALLATGDAPQHRAAANGQ